MQYRFPLLDTYLLHEIHESSEENSNLTERGQREAGFIPLPLYIYYLPTTMIT